MPDHFTVSSAAELLKQPPHRVRRTIDRLWPECDRIGRTRVIPRQKLCELAAAIAARYGEVQS